MYRQLAQRPSKGITQIMSEDEDASELNPSTTELVLPYDVVPSVVLLRGCAEEIMTTWQLANGLLQLGAIANDEGFAQLFQQCAVVMARQFGKELIIKEKERIVRDKTKHAEEESKVLKATILRDTERRRGLIIHHIKARKKVIHGYKTKNCEWCSIEAKKNPPPPAPETVPHPMGMPFGLMRGMG
jgi:hypothetical protein